MKGMKPSKSLRGGLVVGIAAILFGAGNAQALDFGTVILEDDFEAYANGAPVTTASPFLTPPTGQRWQSIAGAITDSGITDAQSFGSGSQSMELSRTTNALGGLTGNARNWGVGELGFVTTENSVLGWQYDVYYEGTGGTFNMFWNDNGAFQNKPGQLFNVGNALFGGNVSPGNFNTGFTVGVGWQTIEVQVAILDDPEDDNIADAEISIWLTRHAGNSEGVLARTQVASFNDLVLYGGDFRLDVGIGGLPTSNPGETSFFIDNVKAGLVIPEPASLALVGMGLAMFLRRRA